VSQGRQDLLFGMPSSSCHRRVLLLGEEDHAADRFLKFPLAYFSGFGSSRRIRCEVGDRLGEGWMLHHLALAGLADGKRDQARDWAEQASSIAEIRQDPELTHACTCLRAQFST
jgi:hypothetical protein